MEIKGIVISKPEYDFILQKDESGSIIKKLKAKLHAIGRVEILVGEKNCFLYAYNEDADRIAKLKTGDEIIARVYGKNNLYRVENVLKVNRKNKCGSI